MITFDEDRTLEVDGYIGAGKIDAAAGYIPICDYDATVTGKTALYIQVADPCQASDPSPVGPDAPLTGIMLTWTAGDACGTPPDFHDVYYGSSYTAVRDATTGSAEYEGNTTDPCWPISETLNYGDTRFWRIDENFGGTVVPGRIWNFSAMNYLLIETFNTDVYANTDALDDVWIANDNATVYAETVFKNDRITGSDQ